MKISLTFIFWWLIMMGASAQRVKVYGQLSYKDKPAADVLITVFDGEQFSKKFITNRKGQFRFYIDKSQYTILFYKPGFEPFSTGITNRLEADVQMIPITSELIKSTQSNDSALIHSKMLHALSSTLAQSYIQYVYQYERGRNTTATDSNAKTTRHLLLRQAIAERDRFKNYKKSTSTKSVNNEQKQITTTLIGADSYELAVNPSGEKQYSKNGKPITEVTYYFETTRRYEGVLLNKKDVKKFEKYEPMLHLR